MQTQVLIDGKPGTIVAESPRALYFESPTGNGDRRARDVEDVIDVSGCGHLAEGERGAC